MTKLYELTENMKSLEKLGEDGEIDAQTIIDTMEGIEASFEDKAINVYHVVQSMDSDATAIDDEIKRLTARKKILTNRKDSIRDYLLHNMEATGITKISCPLFTITLAKGRDVVSISDIDDLPTDYVNFETKRSPMKREILAKLKDGEVISGATLVKSKPSLRIK